MGSFEASPAPIATITQSRAGFLALGAMDLSSSRALSEADEPNSTTTTSILTTTVFTSTSTTTTRAACSFALIPQTPFVWDLNCHGGPGGVSLGCRADGIHQFCRFCGEAPYAPCPKTTVTTSTTVTITKTRTSTSEISTTNTSTMATSATTTSMAAISTTATSTTATSAMASPVSSQTTTTELEVHYYDIVEGNIATTTAQKGIIDTPIQGGSRSRSIWSLVCVVATLSTARHV